MNKDKEIQSKNFLNVIVQLCFFILISIMMLRQALLLFEGGSLFASSLFSSLFIVFGITYLLFRVSVGGFSFRDFLLIILFGAFFIIVKKDILEYKEEVLPFLEGVLVLSMLNSPACKMKLGWRVFELYVIFSSVLLGVGAFVTSNYSRGELLYYTKNSNQSAILIFCYFLGLYIFRFVEEKRFSKKIVYDILMVWMFCLAYITQSRTVIISMIIMVAFLFLPLKKVRYYKLALWFFMILSFVLPYMISMVIEFLGDDFLLFGETLNTGREVIWKNIIKVVWDDLFSVHLGKSVPTKGFAYYGDGLHSHNVFLEVAWRYSAVISVVVMLLFYKVMQFFVKNTSDKAIRLLVPCLCAVFWHMTFEANFFVGAFDYTLICLLPMVFVVQKYPKEL